MSEDLNIAEAAHKGYLTIEKLEAMTCVCSVGLDMVPIPGDITEECLAGIIADEMAIGMINAKKTATRLIPVPGKKAGEKVYFGGLLGEIIFFFQGQGPDHRFCPAMLLCHL